MSISTNTLALSPAQRAGVTRYEEAVSGIPDSFDGFRYRADGGLDQFSMGATRDDLSGYFDLLKRWHSALDDLAGDLTDDGTKTRRSEDAELYLRTEVTAWFQMLHLVRRAALIALIGECGPRPSMDANALDFNGVLVSVGGEIAAESILH